WHVETGRALSRWWRLFRGSIHVSCRQIPNNTSDAVVDWPVIYPQSPVLWAVFLLPVTDLGEGVTHLQKFQA
ncbi:hypothetical protein NDU88_002936, partial [Pleurodeles waltl]